MAEQWGLGLSLQLSLSLNRLSSDSLTAATAPIAAHDRAMITIAMATTISSASSVVVAVVGGL